MDRPIVYDQAQGRDYDVLVGWRSGLFANGKTMADALGQTGTVVAGLAATQTGPASLTINIASGDIYQLADVDATSYGSLSPNTLQVLQQGFAAAQTVTLTTTGLSAGHSRWALVQATFEQNDIIPSDDPNGGLLPFLNTSNPSGPPWSGPGNTGTTLPTHRSSQCILSVIYGAIATAGAEVPPNPSSGCVGLYLIDLAFGQTAVTNGEILVAGPSVGTGVPNNYPYAPFLAGLLNSHHDGNPGQAPQINLTSEVQGILPAAQVGGLGCWRGEFAETGSTVFTSSADGYILRLTGGATGASVFNIGVPAGGEQFLIVNDSAFNLVVDTDGTNRFYGLLSASSGWAAPGSAVASFTVPSGSSIRVNGEGNGNWLVDYNTVAFATAASSALALLKANNLSDLASAPTARTNLGLGSAATQATSAFDAAGAAATAQSNAEAFATALAGNFSGVQSVTGNTTFTSSNSGEVLRLTGGATANSTFTLPNPAAGQVFALVNESTTWDITATSVGGSAVFYGLEQLGWSGAGGGATSFVLQPETIAILVGTPAGYLIYYNSLAFAPFGKGSATPVVFNTPGTTTWTVPAAVYTIWGEAVGGGGAGGGSSSTYNGGAGGAGGFAADQIAVTPGQTITVVVGAGGTTTTGNGGNGGTSSCTAGISATGGTGGKGSAGNVAGGFGGSGTVGTIQYEGGSGTDGTTSSISGILGTGGTWTGVGGASYYGGGCRSGNTAGSASGAPGSGGGGSYGNTTATAGQPGNAGQVIIRY